MHRLSSPPGCFPLSTLIKRSSLAWPEGPGKAEAPRSCAVWSGEHLPEHRDGAGWLVALW